MATAAELTINTVATAEDLFNEIFGAGVTLVGGTATLQGDGVQSGIYSGALTSLQGISPTDSGVILSRGNVADFTNATGATKVNAGTSTDVVGGIDGDLDMNSVAGQATFDATIMEAQFIPTGDTMTIQLVFSSEEYLEYVGGGVNDSLNLFVNGTKVDFVLGTGNVSIDEITDTNNANLYLDNPAGTDNYNTEMDGLTVVLTYKADVNPGVANDIKIGIADGGDAEFDSNVLIMANSVQSVAIANDDTWQIAPSSTAVFDPLANDDDLLGNGLTVTQINGVNLLPGQSITLGSGEQITLNADNTFTVTSDADLVNTAFTYTVDNGTGTTDIGIIQLETLTNPPADGVVEGTTADDVIDAAYLGDPEGDRVDNNDAILPGTTGDDDSIDAGAGNDTVDGGSGNDTIFGGSGDDVLSGGTGDDVMSGGDDQDTFVIEDGFGNDTITGGEGGADADTLDLSSTTTGLTLDLTDANPETGSFTDGADTATFTEIENIVLGGGRDTIVLADGSGSDTVQAFDLTDSGDGTTNDQLDVSGLTSDGGTTPVHAGDVVVTDTNGDGTGDAILTFPGGESITLVGVLASQVDSIDELVALGIPDGRDYIVEGTAGNDTIDQVYAGDPEGDMVDANDNATGTNDDLILAGDGNDLVFGVNGNDTIDGGNGDDTLDGGVGNDSLIGGSGNDQFNAGTGDNDIMLGGDGQDGFLVAGAAGNDTIIGGEVDDGVGDHIQTVSTADTSTILTGDGAGTTTGDAVTVFSEIETFSLTSGSNDFFDGTADTTGFQVSTNAGNDTIIGGSGADTILAGASADSVDGGAGADLILAEAGDDTISLSDGFGNDAIVGGETGETNGDTLDLSGVTTATTVDLTNANPEAGTVSDGTSTATFSEIENIVLGGGRDTIVLADGSGDGTTNDQLDVSGLTSDGGTTPVHAGDVVVTDTNGDGTGDAILTFPGGESITLVGVLASQVDSIDELVALGIPDGRNFIVEGTAGGDLIDAAYVGDPEGDMVDAGDNLAGNNDDVILAGAGNDTVAGGVGADSISGGAGDDSILAGDGDDTIYGGGMPGSVFASDFNARATDSGITTSGGSIGTGASGGPAGFQFIGDSYIVADPDEGGADVGDVSSINATFNFDVGTAEAGAVGGISFSFGDPSTISVDPGTGLTEGVSVQLSTSTNEVVFYWNDVEIGREPYGGAVVGLSASSGSLSVDDTGLVTFTSSVTSGGPFTAQIPGTEWADADTSDYAFVAGMNTGSVNPNNGVNNIQFNGTTTLGGALTGTGNDTLEGGIGNDVIYGQDGDDSLVGGTGADALFGGDGLDLLSGGDGNDVLYGGTGGAADQLYGDAGNDLIYAGDGDNTLVRGGDGDDTIFGEEGNDLLQGEVGNDVIYGGVGNDGLAGGDGNDTLYGGDGDDLIGGEGGDDSVVLEDGFGNDTIIGGEIDEIGGDTLDLSAITTDTTVDLTSNDPEAGSVSDGVSTATFTEIENIILGGGRDTIVLADGSGDDTVQAFDMTDSGDGTTNDQLDVSGLTDLNGAIVNTDDITVTDDGLGNAVLTFPGSESITLIGVTPAQLSTPAQLASIGIPMPDYIVEGTAGNDSITAGTYTGDPQGDMVDALDNAPGTNDDLILAGLGDDTVVAGLGNDTVYGGDGVDVISGGIGDDLLDGEAGNDLLYGGDGSDTLIGGAGDDVLAGDLGNGSLVGGDGADVITGGGGDDTILGGIGGDNLNGNAGNDSMDGGADNDSMWGGDGDDTIIGGTGNDALYGGIGNDSIDAGAGTDYIGLTSGNDTVFAGDDADNINVIAGAYADGAVVTVDGGTGGVDSDTLGLDSWTAYRNLVETPDADADSTSGTIEVLDASGNWITVNFTEIETLLMPALNLTPDYVVEGTAGADLINDVYAGDPEGDMVDALDNASGTNDDSIDAGAGSDTVFAGLGNDTVDAGGGNDTVFGDAGDDSIIGGIGDDSLSGGLNNDTVLGGDGADSIWGDEGDDSLVGGAGADTLEGFTGNDTIEGGADNDYIDGAEEDDLLFGDDGNDTILGGSDTGQDTLYGGAGDDSMLSGDGDDALFGGTGADFMVADGGDDTFFIEDGFGNDQIYGGETTEINGDTLDLSATTTGVTVDLTSFNPEVGSFTDGVDTANFEEIENIVLGGGRDTIVLADGSGSDTVQAFDLTDSGDGTTNDQLDVTGLTSDGGTTPVNTDDVVVTDDGSGNAVLTFPGGESITLVGVAPSEVDSPAELAAIGIPSNGAVDGTAGNDSMNVGYTDGEGDQVDGSDGDDDLIFGYGGNDTITAGNGNDTVFGGTGNDTIIGTFGDDSLVGEDGDDWLFGQFGANNTMEGGSGDDTISVRGGSAQANTVDGGSTGETSGDQLIFSNTGPTTTTTLTGDGDGTQTDGTTTTNFTDIERFRIDGSSADDFDAQVSTDNLLIETEFGNDTILSGSGSDTLYSHFGDDVVDGGAGNDLIFDWDGFDSLSGGAGNDTIEVRGSGDNTLSGGTGDDSITAAAGADSLSGGAGSDTIIGGGGSDTIAGGADADSITAGDDADAITLEDGFGNDTILGGEGVTSGADDDTLDMSALTTDTTVDLSSVDPEAGTVTSGADTATFSEIENIVLGGGRDTIVLADGSGADTVQAFDMTDSGDGTTNDQLDVSGMTDANGAIVNTDDVTVTDTNGDGTGDAILIFPGGESITLIGVDPAQLAPPAQLASIGIPAPDYVVTGTAGADLIDGSFTGDPEGDMVDALDNVAGNNVDVIEAGDGNDTVFAGASADTVMGENGDDSIFGEAGNDTLYGNNGNDTIDGGIGADRIFGGADNDSILGGDGADLINDGTGNDTVFGGADADTFITQNGYGLDSIVGGETGVDDDTLRSFINTDSTLDLTAGGTGADPESGTLTSGGGADVVTFSEIENIELGSGNDAVIGSDAGDNVDAGDGADTLFGNAGDDTFVAGNGADWVSGGTGNDSIALDDGTGTGDGVNDTIAMVDGDGNDTLVGFETPTDLGGGSYSGNDQLDVTGVTDLSGNPVNVDDVVVTDTNGDGTGDAILQFPNGETITLQGVPVSEVSSDAQLVAMGIPGTSGDYIVEGTLGDDLINTAYVGDPEGDLIDNTDHIDGSNNDSVEAGAGDDTIDAGTGDDTILGQDGDDEIFLDVSLQNDSIVGGETGETLGDRINFSTIADDITVTFTGAEEGTITDGVSTTTFSEIERFQMGTGNDSVIGSAGNEEIIGNFGDDTILGGGGDDTIFSGFDNDSVEGGTGNDSILTSTGADTVDGGAGDDTIDVGPLDGEVDVVVLQDGSGSDVISGFEAPTDLGGGAYAGNDLLDVTGLTDLDGNPVSTEDVTVTDTNGDGTGDAILTFPNGEQITLVGVTVPEVQDPAQLEAMGIPPFAGDFIVEGTAGDDLIDTAYLGDPEGDMIDNADGVGGSQVDTVVAGAGNDTVLASADNDSVLGEAGNDQLEGGAGNDTLDGGTGSDLIFGGAGDDSVIGGDGADTINGMTSNDVLDGGADNDTFVVEGSFGSDTIVGGETTTTGTDLDMVQVNDVTVVDPVTVTFTGDEAGTLTDGNDTLSFSEIEMIQLGGQNDSVDATAQSAGTEVWLGGGDDTATGGGGNDTFFGFDGNDSLVGGAGDDQLDSDGGNDTLEGGIGNDTLVGDLGDDSLTGGDGADQLFGGLGADTLNVGSDDQAFGGDGDDVFNVTPTDVSGTPLTIVGGEADETLGDTLNITGPAVINMTGAEEGTVTWLDGSVLTFSEIENINYTACFTPGTLIKTALGEVDATDIDKGCVVLTRDNGYQVVRWAAQQHITGAELRANEALRPVRIAAGALGRGAPERDMLVSPQHRVVVSGPAIELLFGEDEVLVAALHLVGRPGITRECPEDGVTYVHFMFDRHEIVMSDGAWTESFQPGDLSIAGLDDAQRTELLTLFPELADMAGQKAYDTARPALKGYQARLLLAEAL